MYLSPEILRHRGEIARAIRNHKYETNEVGIYVPSMDATINGVMTNWVNGKDPQISANLFTTEGRNHTLDVLVAGGTQVTVWYGALFGNSTPLASWTGANFTANALELDDYDEATRVAYIDGTIAAGAVDNSASKAEFTINATITAYGCGLLQASAKNAVTGVCLAASLFSSARPLVATDVLSVQYGLTLT